MSRLYGDSHRELQDTFETRGLADLVEQNAARMEITDADKVFIEARDMFFLSTVNHEGMPTVSYKGGDPGFVKVLDERTLAFPSYDGNGMFLSIGNISTNKQVGLLFIDFEKPKRLRIQGEATISRDDPLSEWYAEPDLIVRVAVSDVFANCPRYVHKHQKVDPSKLVPRKNVEAPLADWKRIDVVQEVLRPRDRGKADEQGGLITVEQYEELINEED